jgi:hypothetical protein
MTGNCLPLTRSRRPPAAGPQAHCDVELRFITSGEPRRVRVLRYEEKHEEKSAVGTRGP